MADSKPIIGPEGLSAPPAIAQQVSAIEKKADEAIASLRREDALRWDGHVKQHEQEQDAVEKAVTAMDRRLDGLNELRQMVNDRDKFMATLTALEETNKRIDRDAVDTRLRFENIDKRLNDMATQLSREARSEGRPGQDMALAQASNAKLIGLAGVILGVVLALIGLASRFMGGGAGP